MSPENTDQTRNESGAFKKELREEISKPCTRYASIRQSGDENSKGEEKMEKILSKLEKQEDDDTENWERDAVRILRPLGVTIAIKGRLKKTTVFLFPLYFYLL